MTTGRIAQLQARLRRRGLDALLVARPENRRYLSGFAAEDLSIAESSGCLLLPAKGTPRLLTDFRYRQQAEEQAPGFEVLLYPKGLIRLLADLLPRLGVRRFAFEGHYFLHEPALKLQKTLGQAEIECISLPGAVEELRAVKTAAELELIARSVRLNERVYQEVRGGLRPGQTEKEVAWRIETVLRRLGAERASFPPIVASGPNGALPHAEPSDRPLVSGEPIIIDMGLVKDGYCSDMTRTVVLGEADALTRERLQLVQRAQQTAIAAARAGISGRQLDAVGRRVLAEAGYGDAFGHGLGHGVGLAVHEAPSVNPRWRKKLKANMVVTIEPGIYLPGWGGIRLENMAVIEEQGCRVLNQLPVLEA